MWIYTRPRNEYDARFLLNMDLCSRVNLTQLGERWFVEVMLGTEAIPVAAAASQEEAAGLMRRVFDSMRAGEKALDLMAPAAEGEGSGDGWGQGAQRQRPMPAGVR